MLNLVQRMENLLDRSPEFFRTDVRVFELNKRFLWFLICRFIVIFTFLFLSSFKQFTLPSISVSGREFLVMASILTVLNLAYWIHYKSAIVYTNILKSVKVLDRSVKIQIVFDFLVLGYLNYKCGGIESPLIFFFLFHSVIACLFFKKTISFLYTSLSLLIIYIISVGPYFGYFRQYHFIFSDRAVFFFNNETVYFYHLLAITVTYFVVWLFAANITDSLKKHEQGLQNKIDELEEMDRERTRYMLVTTHELKAPFSAIQSYVNVLLGGYAGAIPEKVKDVLNKIGSRCQTLTRMVTELLQLANISSLKNRGDEIVMEKLDVLSVIKQAAEKLQIKALEKHVTFVLPDTSAEISANKEQMDILFNNILSNAINYCYPDSEIVVDISFAGDNVIIKVTDNGIGIKKEHLEKVFLEYFRSELAAQLNRESSGLGLTIAVNIVELHKGKIWIESVEGKWTSVFICLNYRS